MLPFEILENKIRHLIQRVDALEKQAGRPRLMPLDDFIKLGYFSKATAYLRLSPRGNGIPGAKKVGRKWFIDLAKFEVAEIVTQDKIYK